MKVLCQYKELVDLHKLVPHKSNPNGHPEKQIEILAKNIEFQGWRHPVIVSKRSGFVVAGHGRLMAAKKLGYTQVPVDYQDFKDEATEFAFLIADNKIDKLAEHDDSLMIEELKKLDVMDFELFGLADFKMEELEEVKNSSGELNLDEFNNFQHQCPKCGFEWDDSGKDNS